MNDGFSSSRLSLYNIVSFFVVAGMVKPFQVAPVELVDYPLLKIIYHLLDVNCSRLAVGLFVKINPRY